MVYTYTNGQRVWLLQNMKRQYRQFKQLQGINLIIMLSKIDTHITYS